MVYSNKIRIAVLFGGKSTEHEISIITGIQVLHALRKSKFEVVPVYVTKDEQWILGDETFLRPETFRDLQKAVEGKPEVYLSSDSTAPFLIEKSSSIKNRLFSAKEKVDIFFPTFHGRYGEDGSVQGLFEIFNVPYVGCGVEASSVGMNKVLSKIVAQYLGIPVLKANWTTKNLWERNSDFETKKLVKGLEFPVFVKPVSLGSSIGLRKVANNKELKDAIEVALFYDQKVMVEKSLENAKEINISILGNNPYKTSVCEQPISSGEILSFEDKYLPKKGESKGMASAKRIVPALIKKDTEYKIRGYATKFFNEIGGEGIARVDFLVSKDESQIFFNEINTMPGSVSFYLWKASGISFDKLVIELVQLGLDRFEKRKDLITSFKNNVLESFKGVKSSKF